MTLGVINFKKVMPDRSPIINSPGDGATAMLGNHRGSPPGALRWDQPRVTYYFKIVFVHKHTQLYILI